MTVLSSDDPVRVFQDFATLDLLSGGRAEIMAGRGSFIESFPLFGYDLGDYDELFAEKLGLLLRLRESEQVTWAGKHRAPLDGQGVYPRPLQDPLPIWIAVGGNPGSAVRAGTLGLPMALAIIGGMPERFAPFAELHRNAAQKAGHTPPALSINSHGYVADTSQQASDEAFPPFAATMEPDRARARLAADDPAAVRGLTYPSRGELRGEPGGGRRKDPFSAPGLSPPTLPGSVQRRNAAARQDHAFHRAFRHTGRASGAQGDRGSGLGQKLPCEIRHLVRTPPRQGDARTPVSVAVDHAGAIPEMFGFEPNRGAPGP